MAAIDISGQAPGGTRVHLAEKLPLNTPFLVQVFPVYACNFKCGYCIFSVDKSKHGFISDNALLDFNLYKKCVDDMRLFPDTIKVVRFVGIGEPLLHKKIVEMVRYTTESNVANKVEIITNGALLTNTMSDNLIAAGLTRLVVSAQGTSAKKYKEVANTNIDFDKFVNNLAYFKSNKGNCEIYVKVIDTALDDEADRQLFNSIFSPVCDTIAIEHTVPLHDAVDYTEVLGKRDSLVTQFGLPVKDVQVCPQPFFHMQINPDGKIVPCYSWDYPKIMGDCRVESLTNIWNGETFREFRRAMLDGPACASKTCAECTIIKYRLFPEDDLRNDAERLKLLYK